MTGTVVEFDEARGLGAVAGEDGRRLGFHCVAIADGSRTIEVGTVVAYDVVAGRLGRWEAARLRPVEADPSARTGDGPAGR